MFVSTVINLAMYRLIALLDLSQEKYLLSYREAAREGVPCSIIPGSVPSAKGASNKLHLHIPVNVDSTKIVEEVCICLYYIATFHCCFLL